MSSRKAAASPSRLPIFAPLAPMTAEPPRLCPWAEMRAASIDGCAARALSEARTSKALAAKLYWVWSATVEVIALAPNGSMTRIARRQAR